MNYNLEASDYIAGEDVVKFFMKKRLSGQCFLRRYAGWQYCPDRVIFSSLCIRLLGVKVSAKIIPHFQREYL